VFRLLYRFYDPNSGHIFIDGQDIHDLQLDSLRRNVGVVPQDTPLFHSNIIHNIRYGRLDATDEEVIAAAVKANVHDTVMKLPDGYDTQVGERGLMISGGEKQRLAVARVMLKDPPILFFDEAVCFSFLSIDSGDSDAVHRHPRWMPIQNLNSCGISTTPYWTKHEQVYLSHIA
jgi:ATP-binding cassette subfamily B (MDR/TAP) protein 7